VVHPKTIAIDDGPNTLYISSLTTNSLYVVNGGDNTVSVQIPVGTAPYGVDVNPVTQKAYVANTDDNTISVIDLTANTVIATIPLDPDSKPLQVAVNPDTNKIYVTLHNLNQVAVIDGTTDTVIKTIPDLPGAFDVIVNRPDNQVYVSARDAHFVSVIDGATDVEKTRLSPGGETYALAFDPALKQLYTLIAPDGPLYLLDNPVGDIYLPLPDLTGQQEPNPNVVIIFEVKPNYDFGRRGYRIAGEAGPQGGIGIAANPSTGNFFVSNSAANSLSVFDGVSLVTLATVPMDGDPGDIAVNPVTNLVYVSNRSADVVHMIVDGW
jgi:YVTN family beta-propeller protein